MYICCHTVILQAVPAVSPWPPFKSYLSPLFYLDTVLQFLLNCLRDSKLSNASATALDKVCDKCANEQRMIQNFPTLLQIVRDVDSFHIKSDATIKLIKGNR